MSPTSLREVAIVAWREVRLGLQTRSYWAVVIGLPLLLALAPAAVALLGARVEAEAPEFRVAVADRTGVLAEHFGRRVDDPFVLVERATENNLDEQVERGEIDGYLVFDAHTLETGRTTLRARKAPSTFDVARLEDAVERAVLRARLGDQVDVLEHITAHSAVQVVDLSPTARDLGKSASVRTMLTNGGVFLILIGTMFWAGAVLATIADEKQSGEAEMLIAMVEPWKLLLGKAIGVFGLAFVNVLTWSAPFVALVAARGSWSSADGLPSVSASIAVVLALFVLHFVAVTSVLAAVASAADTARSPSVKTVTTVLLNGPMLVALVLAQQPTGQIATVAGAIPLLTAPLAWARFVETGSPWQLLVSIAWLTVCIAASARFAGRLYQGSLAPRPNASTMSVGRWLGTGSSTPAPTRRR